MLTVVTWKWHRPGYRSTFTAAQVNVLRAMVDRHYAAPHRFVCVTDNAKGLDSSIQHVPIDDTMRRLLAVPSPHGGNNPSCYIRLRSFDGEWARTNLGERFVSLDLDTVIVRDMAPVWDRPNRDFLIWGDTAAWARTWYNGSMFLMDAGARQKVWSTFDPKSSPRRAYAAGCRGSDQGWISYCLGQSERRWTTEDGVYSWRVHLKNAGGRLPDNARVVFFHGLEDPWNFSLQRRHPWIAQHWR